jgi:probable rRNA maturation factor
MNIVIANCQRLKKIDSRLLKEIASAILAELEIEHCELEINLVGAKQMAEINWQFLKHEGSTDVITFDYLESESKIQNPELGLCGEIFVCVDEAISQSKKFKTDWQSEIVRYIVHGILHLLGHDDLQANARRKMKCEENLLVRKFAKKFSLAQIGSGSKLARE